MPLMSTVVSPVAPKSARVCSLVNDSSVPPTVIGVLLVISVLCPASAKPNAGMIVPDIETPLISIVLSLLIVNVPPSAIIASEISCNVESFVRLVIFPLTSKV